MSGNIYYGHCCNRIIVSRRWRYCPFCGGPLAKNKQTGELERTTQATYASAMAMAETRAIDREDLRAQIEMLEHKNSALETDADRDLETIRSLEARIHELELLVQLAADGQMAVPRAPDIVVVDEDVPGVTGGLASVQEACANISTRGVNIDKPCMRPRENPERTHQTGRHRY